MIDFELRGGKYHLYFNGEALFRFYEKFGKEKTVMEVIEPATKEGYEATVWLLCELSHQGELYRRFLGEEPEKPLEYMKTLVQVQPAEIIDIKKAVLDAITEGFKREHPDPELEEDPWLAEVEAKKKQTSRALSITERLRRALDCLFGKA